MHLCVFIVLTTPYSDDDVDRDVRGDDTIHLPHVSGQPPMLRLRIWTADRRAPDDHRDDIKLGVPSAHARRDRPDVLHVPDVGPEHRRARLRPRDRLPQLPAVRHGGGGSTDGRRLGGNESDARHTGERGRGRGRVHPGGQDALPAACCYYRYPDGCLCHGGHDPECRPRKSRRSGMAGRRVPWVGLGRVVVDRDLT